MSTSPAPSPRRGHFAFSGTSSPRPSKTLMSSRLPSISSTQPLEIPSGSPPPSARPSLVHGFSPNSSSITLAFVAPASPRLPTPLNTRLPLLSPQITTPVEQTLQYVWPPDTSPRPVTASPRPIQHEFPPRSRRNSAAVVSISLSSRSRSRTPRGSAAVLPGGSGQATPNKGSSTVTPRGEDGGKEVVVQMMDSWAPGVDEMDEWQPAGGMLLEGQDESAIEDDMDEDERRTDRKPGGEEEDVVGDVLAPGMLFGEGLDFQGEVVKPAVGKVGNGSSDEGLPLRRGGSEVTRGARTLAKEKKAYEVVRKLGTGSYAVVYLVRERGGRKREYALKCLSKQDLEEEQIETQLFEATIHLSLPIHQNIVTLHQTLQTRKWLFLMLELCPGEDLFYWLEKSRDASPPANNVSLPEEVHPMSSSKFSSSSIPFSSSQLFSNLNNLSSSFSNSPSHAFSPYGASPASLLFAHHNGNGHHHFTPSQTPPTPSLLSAFSANTLLSSRRLRLIASMFSQMCEAVAVCHDAGVSHRDIKPENFICCDSVELEAVAEGELDFGPQAKRKVVVKLTDFGLATTDEESGDVECGSKPYMSYECRNNLGPTYIPAPADVWSLGIVLINMLFHRNPWKDPTEGDPNFDNFLRDPAGFLLSKFTGIGREVATYLADHIICVDVTSRVAARDLGQWIKSLPEMIAGKKAVHALKVARAEAKDKDLFVKSPVESTQERKASASALTNPASLLTASHPLNLASPVSPPPVEHTWSLPTPDLDRDELKSASTVDDQPTPSDLSGLPSPDTVEAESTITGATDDADSQSLSTHKRRKRGVRKGKAAQAALAAAQAGEGPSQEERDTLLAELAAASQSLARDLSKVSQPELDLNRVEDFPPLGMTPAQLAAQKKSKWKDLMKMSSGNPELAALRQRVAEREASTGGNWSAPAKLQGDFKKPGLGLRSTATASSGISSALSSFGPVSSATSSSGGVDEDDWRKPREGREGRDEVRGRDRVHHHGDRRNDSTSRARQAALAAAAITGSMDPMGSFGQGPGHSKYGPLHGRNLSSHLTLGPPSTEVRDVRTIVPIATPAPRLPRAATYSIAPALHPISDDELAKTPAAGSAPFSLGPKQGGVVEPEKGTITPGSTGTTTTTTSATSINVSTLPASTTMTTRPSFSSQNSASTVTIKAAPLVVESPNKPKIKGQIQSLAKMLSGLKTKGKE